MIKKEVIILLLIILLGFLFRLWQLTTSPSGLYIDETSIGYNAFSIIKTGYDEHGKFMPLFFEAFGEYKLPVYIYLVAAFQFFIGPTDFSVRLPALIFGVSTIPLIFFLSKELLNKQSNSVIKNSVPYLAAFLLAISPWHFQFSRPGFEVSIGLFFLILALYLFLRSVRNKSVFILTGSSIFFVLTLYSYNSARIVTPIVVLTLFILYFKYFDLKKWIIVFSIGTIISLPFLHFAFSPEGLIRARQVSIFYQSTEKSKMVQFLSNYLANISPFYLFGSGDPTIAHLTPYRMSLIYLVELPFFIIGLARILFRRSRESLLILIILFSSFIPPAISTLNPHALRAFFALSVTPFISALGFGYFLSEIRFEKTRKVILGAYLLILIVFSINFLNVYHNKYTPSAGWDWQVGIKKASYRVLDLKDSYQNIYFGDDIQHVSVLWYLKYNPREFLLAIDKNNLGKYHFDTRSVKLIPETQTNLYISGGSVEDENLLEYIYYPNGTIAYGIWVI